MSWKGIPPTASTIVDIFPYRAGFINLGSSGAVTARDLPEASPALHRGTA